MEQIVAAAVQAAYVLMDRKATLDKTVDLVRQAAAEGARLIVFPEAFVPGTPIWIDSGPIWEGDEQWYTMLVDQAVVVPSRTTEGLGAAARDAGAYVVVGVDDSFERVLQTGAAPRVRARCARAGVQRDSGWVSRTAAARRRQGLQASPGYRRGWGGTPG